MKEEYTKLEVRVDNVDSEDIITTSDGFLPEPGVIADPPVV